MKKTKWFYVDFITRKCERVYCVIAIVGLGIISRARKLKSDLFIFALYVRRTHGVRMCLFFSVAIPFSIKL